MEWGEIERQIREKAAQQPRGFYATLARKLGIKLPSVSQALGPSAKKGVPPAMAEQALNLMGYELGIIETKKIPQSSDEG